MKTALKVIVFFAIGFVMSACKPTVEPPTETTYTVTFNANAENVTGTMDMQTFTKGVAQKLTKNTYSRTGYLFSGWAESETATTVMYADEASFTATKNTTLYAIWIETIKFKKPRSGATQEYTGSELTQNVTGFDASNMTITGDTIGKSLGEYTVTINLKDSKATWSDNTKGPVTVTWKIVQATNRWEIEPSITNWYETYTSSEPQGKALFGIVVFTYKKIDGTVLGVKPTEAGSYKLIASVEGTSNYTQLIKEVDFAVVAPSSGLKYEVNEDGTASVTGIGTFTGTGVVIASSHKGLPVTSISSNAFINQTTLTSVVIPDSLIIIEDQAFFGCSSLESVIIGDSVETIGRLVFYGCSALVEIECKENNSTYTSKNGVLYNKSATKLILYPRGKKETSFSIPNTVETIMEAAFQDTQLTSVEIPDSVKTIDNGAFYGCSSLEGVEIGDSVTVIGFDSFYGCSSLESVEIPGSVEIIGNSAFYGCSSLTSLVIGGSVTAIGESAFSGCSSLKKVEIPDSVEEIGPSAFGYCTSLESVEIGSSVTTIGDTAFSDCSSLISVEISDSVETIGAGAFFGCRSLKRVEIPISVEKIEPSTFGNCTSLESVEIGNSVTTIGDFAFSDCRALTSVVIPDSVETIGKGSFSNCISLERVEIGGDVTTIGEGAFFDCKVLTSITMPASITSYIFAPFEGCDSLTVYAKSKDSSGWHSTWDSSSRPVVWGCVLSDGISESPYVMNVEKKAGSIDFDTKRINAPYRKGYTFVGWSSNSSGSAIPGGADALRTANNGNWYAVWTAN